MVHSRALSLALSGAVLGAALFLGVGCGGSVEPVSNKTAGTPIPNEPAPTPTTPTPTGTPGNPGNPPVVDPPVPAIVASAYDQTCALDADCIAITEIAICGCACPNAAINQKDQPRLDADEAAHAAACAQQSTQTACGVDCVDPHVFCDTSTGATGTCRLTNP